MRYGIVKEEEFGDLGRGNDMVLIWLFNSDTKSREPKR
jgi:hypothetical protein